MIKRLYLFLFIFCASFPGFAQTLSKKNETFAIIGFFVLAIAGIITYYIRWKNRKEPKSGNEKFKIKTFEVIKNGRKVVMTKKYRASSGEEFPESVKRRK
jgi:hypothetical protein